MKKIIVTTTINSPTQAIISFDEMKDWDLIVVGDKKTPLTYKLKKGHYISPVAQEKYDKKLSDAIGWNCIQRRNIGYLLALDMGADIIASVDDDNIPLKGWGEKVHVGQKIEVNQYATTLDAFDPIGATNYPKLWHRGFPLQLLPQREYVQKSKVVKKFDVQADFWNGDPDVDAICRMEHEPECTFKTTYFPFTSNKISPFNSQNTFFTKEILKNYFLFPGIGRMDDIWASYYVQSLGYKVFYQQATVYQQRNIHDLTKDMKLEYLGYEHNLEIVQNSKKNPHFILDLLPEQAKIAFKLYQKHF